LTQSLFMGLLLLTLTILISPPIWRAERAITGLEKGKLAEGNIKATRTFEYQPPDEKIEKERKAAAARVPYVFDHREDLADVIARRIRKAFEVLAQNPDAGPPPAGTPTDAGVKASWADAQRKQMSDILQVQLTADDFNRLRHSASLREVRGILLALVVEEGMRGMVIAKREDLNNFRDKPVVVRHLRSDRTGQVDEEPLTNLGAIKDLAQVARVLRTKADMHAAKLPPDLARVVVRLAQAMVVPNLTFNSTETNERVEKARGKVSQSPITYVKGQVIVRDGDPLTATDLRVLAAMEPAKTSISRIQVPLGAGVVALMLLLVQFTYARRGFKRFFHRPRDVVAMSVLLLGLVGLMKSVVALGGGMSRGQELPVFIYAIPLAAGPMLVRLLISSEAAALFATVLALLSSMLVDNSLIMAIFYLITGLLGAAGVSRVQSRSTILRAGLWTGLAGAVMVLGTMMFQDQLFEVATFYAMLAGLAGGILAAFVTLALLPAMEWLFAYTTDVTLLELANLNHPLLRDLILRAPGTYHHSMVVGSLSEAACEAVGANGLLTRVAAYYHDIGKTKNSEYFAENYKAGEDPHSRLKPSMSVLIIRSHVKDTVEMLRQHGVPELVIDTATQHHGQTLIEYFYHKAKESAEDGEEIEEEEYRYPGPMPQSREAGILMLADGVEAAARSLGEPTEDRLRAVVQRLINTKFTDGQLQYCDLTLRDLHLIARSFLGVLGGIYHQRPTYPWQKKGADGRREGEGGRRETGRHRSQGEPRGKDAQEGKGARGGRGKGKGSKGKGGQERGGKARGRKGKSSEEANGHGREHRHSSRGGGDGRDQRPGEGTGAEQAESGGPDEVTTESNPDLKRLGLN